MQDNTNSELAFNDLPIEIQEYVFSFYSDEVRVILRFVCKLWNEINKKFSAKSKGYEFIYWLIEDEEFKLVRWAIKRGAKYKNRIITEVAALKGNIEIFKFLISKDAHYD